MNVIHVVYDLGCKYKKRYIIAVSEMVRPEIVSPQIVRLRCEIAKKVHLEQLNSPFFAISRFVIQYDVRTFWASHRGYRYNSVALFYC